jgi:tRNA pseudouridine32 synthase / 23S rRNA pseudouridine746 synthase
LALDAYCPPAHTGLDIVYLDESLLVLNKPAGLLSVPGRGEGMDDCLASRAQAEFPEALMVHRLDMATSGLLVLARGKEMHRQLSIQFQDRQVEKRYLAIVADRLNSEYGEIDLPLICDWPNRPRQKVDFDVGKPSLTGYRLISHDPIADTSRVELSPVTGRSHQLRVHMAALGHPILGDDLYGGAAFERSARLLLHAMDLGMPHPLSGTMLHFHCAAPF